MDIKNNLSVIKNLIRQYELQYGREPRSVKLLAASKGQSIEKIEQVFNAGQAAFGENYLQEALQKIQQLAHLAIEWHFIGPIQSNKTRKIAQHFAWVHSIDDLKIAERLNHQRPATLPPLNVCIQVNISAEASKSGIALEEMNKFAETFKNFPRLKLRGLMSIPTAGNDFATQRKYFHRLFLAYQTLCSQGFLLDTLSMGMSADFAAAIAEGSTLVRIGTAIFGKREDYI